MNRNTILYLRDIIDNIGLIEEFTRNMTFESFSTDNKTVYAVLRCLEIIGEAAKNVPPDIRTQYPEIPWKDMAGMRDRVIHFYFGVNYEKVWQTIKEDIPAIKPMIERVLREIEAS